MRCPFVLACAFALGCGSSSTTAPDMTAPSGDMSAAIVVDAGPPECDPVNNTGCAAGEKCTIGSDHGGPRSSCFPIASAPVAEGGDCMSVTMGELVGDNCAAGLSYKGVDDAQAVFGGRELRVYVREGQVDDLRTVELSQEIAAQIADELTFPGQIKVTVIRAFEAVTTAN